MVWPSPLPIRTRYPPINIVHHIVIKTSFISPFEAQGPIILFRSVLYLTTFAIIKAGSSLRSVYSPPCTYLSIAHKPVFSHLEHTRLPAALVSHDRYLRKRKVLRYTVGSQLVHKVQPGSHIPVTKRSEGPTHKKITRENSNSSFLSFRMCRQIKTKYSPPVYSFY